jgi:hypothetical protein
MTSIGIVGNANRETILELIALIKQIPDLKIIFIKQSEERLYIVTERLFSILQEGKNAE